MALIKQANAKELTQGAIVLDLGDLRRQGEAIIEHARKQAAQIVRDGEAERDRLVAGAAEKGHAEGLARGTQDGLARGHKEGRAAAMDEAKREAAAVASAWERALADFATRREQMLLEARHDVLRLAVLIAEKVTKRTIAIDPAVAAAQVESVLGLVSRPTEVVLLIHPDDRPIVEQVLPAVTARLGSIRGVQLIEDPALGRGSCVARMRGTDGSGGGAGGGGGGGAGGGEIDASIATQLDRIIEVLLPGEPRNPGTSAEGAAP